jgi:hypothetical protein
MLHGIELLNGNRPEDIDRAQIGKLTVRVIYAVNARHDGRQAFLIGLPGFLGCDELIGNRLRGKQHRVVGVKRAVHRDRRRGSHREERLSMTKTNDTPPGQTAGLGNPS